MTDTKFHALLIGADGYLRNSLSNGGVYQSLGGCVNDIRRVEAMLRQRIGERLEVTMLVATASDVTQGVDESSWPTAANIRRALDELAARAQPGDQVYVHYSGHGGRVRTAWKELKGNDGVDEALVPIDIGRPDVAGEPPYTRPERYIRDVELAYLLDRLANKRDGADRGIAVTLVFDSCLSGGATRGLGDLATRTASPPSIDEREYIGDAKIAEQVRATFRSRAATRGVEAPQTSWLPPARGYVLLAACRDVEAALEAALDGKQRAGVLTAAFLEALAALGTEQSWTTVYNRVLAVVQSRAASQMPQLLGDVDRQVLGVVLRPLPPSMIVRHVDAEQRTVTLDGGMALDVVVGAQIGIYAPGERDFSVDERCLARATITSADAFQSVASLEPGADPTRVAVGAPAIATALSLRRRVMLVERTDLPPEIATMQTAALDAVRDAIAKRAGGFLEACASAETPHYQVALTPESTFELCDMQGAPFRYLEPVMRMDMDDAASTIVGQLRRLCRYHTLLAMAEPSGELLARLRVELLIAPADWDPRQPPSNVGGTRLERTGDGYAVRTGTWLWLRLTNETPKSPLNFGVLNLSRKWEVELLVPNATLPGARYETIQGIPRTFSFRMSAPIPETIDILKLFVFTGDVDLPALATATPRAVTRGGTMQALDRLVDAINASEYRTRSISTARSTTPTWAVRELRVRTYQ